MPDVLDLTLYSDDLIKLGFRFLHDLAFLALIVRFAWQPNSKDRQFAFAAIMLNITVFFICFAMQKLELSLGMALGLFAIFGVLRYRTTSISTKDLTYLFVVIGVAVINALSNGKTSYIELLAVNAVLVIAAMAGEWLFTRALAPSPTTTPATPPRLRKQTINYDRLELLAPDRRDDLLADLRARTHLPISKARVEEIDLPKGRATLAAWYEDAPAD